jgi:hypothetical protein
VPWRPSTDQPEPAEGNASLVVLGRETGSEGRRTDRWHHAAEAAPAHVEASLLHRRRIPEAGEPLVRDGRGHAQTAVVGRRPGRHGEGEGTAAGVENLPRRIAVGHVRHAHFRCRMIFETKRWPTVPVPRRPR